MANIVPQDFSTVGIAPTFTAAAAGGDTFVNDGNTYFLVKNSSASSINVTADSQQQCSHGFDHDMITAVAAGATKQIGPFATSRFNNEAGNVIVTYSAAASVTVAALKLS
jgi:hypothetical protein